MRVRINRYGKNDPLARLSRGKKLIAGSLRAIHMSANMATPANTTIRVARCHGFESGHL